MTKELHTAQSEIKSLNQAQEEIEMAHKEAQSKLKGELTCLKKEKVTIQAELDQTETELKA